MISIYEERKTRCNEESYYIAGVIMHARFALLRKSESSSQKPHFLCLRLKKNKYKMYIYYK